MAILFPFVFREGLASVHFTAEKGNYLHKLQAAEEKAKEKKLCLWQNYSPELEKKPEVEGKAKEKKLCLWQNY